MARHAAGLRVEVSVSGADAEEGNPDPRTPAASAEQPEQYARGPVPLANRGRTVEGPPGGRPATDTSYLLIFVTRPAPTVRPPSRMANRSWSSMAIGWISSTCICVVSPGMTISVPSGRVTTPVTSVVRK